jgi:hypothetical protein
MLMVNVCADVADWHDFVTTDKETYALLCGGWDYANMFRALEEKVFQFQRGAEEIMTDENALDGFAAYVHECVASQDANGTALTLHDPEHLSEGCGGLGNRLMGMTTIFALALLHDKAFYLRHNFPVPITEYFVPINRNLNLTFPDHVRDHRSRLGKPLREEWLWVPEEWLTTQPNLIHEKKFYQNDVLYFKTWRYGVNSLHTNPHHLDALRRLSPMDKITSSGDVLTYCLQNYLFHPSEKIMEAYREMLEVLTGPHRTFLAIHVRTGGDGAWHDDVFGLSNASVSDPKVLPYFHCAAAVEEEIRSKGVFRHVMWLLASDSNRLIDDAKVRRQSQLHIVRTCS